MYPFAGLPENLAAFCEVLRRQQVFRIGPGELHDAARALEVVDLADERAVRHGLRPILGSTLDEVTVFDAEGRNQGFNHQMQEVRIPRAQYESIGTSNFKYKLNVQLGKGAFTIVITLRDDLSNEIGSASEAVSI